MIQYNELNTPNLVPAQKMALVIAANFVEQGVGEVDVTLTYRKVTNTPPSIAGKDYVAQPGVSSLVQMGTLRVKRYVDNAHNRRELRVGKVYFYVDSLSRADGTNRSQSRNLCPEGIQEFVVTGVRQTVGA